ncbi:MAG TPA: substrate-binding domain-containing protein, partial [Thermoanaerobaculia bacterium]|nr:substrate-binding domain-containing protein [Thermoanaerobaculia bacterium]
MRGTVRGLALAAGVAVAFGAVSCGKSKSAKHLIGFSQCNLGEPWRVAMNAQVAERATAFPDIEIAFADAQQDNAKQVADVENFLRQKIDLLMISPNEAKPLTPIVRKVFEAGIPVIILDRAIEGDTY